jgi:hypothetical protein
MELIKKGSDVEIQHENCPNGLAAVVDQPRRSL